MVHGIFPNPISYFLKREKHPNTSTFQTGDTIRDTIGNYYAVVITGEEYNLHEGVPTDTILRKMIRDGFIHVRTHREVYTYTITAPSHCVKVDPAEEIGRLRRNSQYMSLTDREKYRMIEFLRTQTNRRS